MEWACSEPRDVTTGAGQRAPTQADSHVQYVCQMQGVALAASVASTCRQRHRANWFRWPTRAARRRAAAAQSSPRWLPQHQADLSCSRLGKSHLHTSNSTWAVRDIPHLPRGPRACGPNPIPPLRGPGPGQCTLTRSQLNARFHVLQGQRACAAARIQAGVPFGVGLSMEPALPAAEWRSGH